MEELFINSKRAPLDICNYITILVLEKLGIKCPSQEQIDSMEPIVSFYFAQDVYKAC